MTKKLDVASTSLLTRTLDAVDRTHAGTAMRLHEVRNQILAALERSLDHAEKLSASLIARARTSVKRVDQVSADVVNRAQGAVGHAIEKARLARSTPAHMPS